MFGFLFLAVMKILTTLLTFFTVAACLAQTTDTIYLDYSNKACEPEKAYEYRYWTKQPNGKYIVYKHNYTTKKLVETSECSSVKPLIRDGIRTKYFSNSKLFSTSFYVNNLLQDTLTVFTQDGSLKSIEIYKDDTAIIELSYYPSGKLHYNKQYREGKVKKIDYYYETGELRRKEAFARNGEMMVSQCFTKSGADTIYYPSEVVPEFHDDNSNDLGEFLGRSMKYPYYAKMNGIEGMVVTQFTVAKNGEIVDVEVLYSDHDALSEEAVRVINLFEGKFTPAKFEGDNVNLIMRLPIFFRLDR